MGNADDGTDTEPLLTEAIREGAVPLHCSCQPV